MSPAGALAAALSFLSLSLPISSSSSSSLRRPSPPPMVLPLVLSFPNTSRLRSGDGDGDSPFRRRQLQKKDAPSSARMRLYDDLLTNGYYTTRLYIGTPPQEFALIVDSGSTVTYVPCSTCEQCGNHQDPKFQPDLSSSYKPISCNIDCNCDKEKNQCSYERQYAEMSSSSGVLGTDVVSFGNLSALDAQRVEFGCENMETGDIFSQHADGIMGLGRGPLSIMDQLVEKNVISDSFSLCYGGMDIGGGAMVLGSIPFPPEMVFSHSDPVRSPYYNIELKEIRVSGQSLKVNPSVFNSRHGTVLDSGTTYAYLPQAAFGALRDSVHVLSFKGEGNTSFVKLVIIPGDSGASNLNATEIVYRLTEHHIHLPENFGGYELLEWNFQPVHRRTWLQQHTTIIITLGVTATVGLSLGTFLGWYFWKRRQRFSMYRPVDAPVPEQELQPL